MPNWCATNYAVTGHKTELQQFADLVNSLPSREDVKENGFGKFWLGNLAVHLGGDWKKGHFRGVLNLSGRRRQASDSQEKHQSK